MSAPAGAPSIPRGRKDSEASLRRRDSFKEVIEQHWPFNKRRSGSSVGVADGPSTAGDLSDSGRALQSVLQKDEPTRTGSDSESDASASGNSKRKRFNSLTRVLSYRKRKSSEVGEAGSVNSSTQTSSMKERSRSEVSGERDIVMFPVAEDTKAKEDGALDLGSPPSSPTVDRVRPPIAMTPTTAFPPAEESGILGRQSSAGDTSAGTKVAPSSSAPANSTTFAEATGTTEGDWENVQGDGTGQHLKGQGSPIATDDGNLADESEASFMNEPGTVPSATEDATSTNVHPGHTNQPQAVLATPAIKNDGEPPINHISPKVKPQTPIDELPEKHRDPKNRGEMTPAAQYAVTVVLALSLAIFVGMRARRS